MNIETFRIFCDVVHYQSFSRGAEANNISQSAATQSIHRLEKQLGTQLIDRTKRPFVLTQEGQICYEGFREILETYDSIVTRVQSLYNQGGGTIHVAAIYSVGLHDMSKCMRNFMKECPKSKIRLEFLHPAKVYQAVLNSEADVGVVSYPTSSPEINVIPIRSEEMVVVVPVGHPLAKEKTLTLEQLQNVDYVAFDRELFIRKETDRHMRQRNVHVNIVMEFDNIETIKQAIEVGVGVSILPAPTVMSDVESGKMVAIPLISPKLSRPIGVIYKHRKVFSAGTTRFIEMLGGAIGNAEEAEPQANVRVEPGFALKPASKRNSLDGGSDANDDELDEFFAGDLDFDDATEDELESSSSERKLGAASKKERKNATKNGARGKETAKK